MPKLLPPPMAGLSTTFHHPDISKPLNPPSSVHLLTASLCLRGLNDSVRLVSVSGSNTISTRYGGGPPRTSQSDDEEALDLSTIRHAVNTDMSSRRRKEISRRKVQELKMGYNIDVHDYSVRLKAAQKFLKDGDKVKVIVNLKGRENEFRNNAIELLRRFQNDIGELGIEENKDFRERNIFIVLVSNKVVAQKSQEPPTNRKNPSESEISAGV